MYALGQEIAGDEGKARGYFARAEALGYDWRPMAATMGLEVGEWEGKETGPRSCGTVDGPAGRDIANLPPVSSRSRQIPAGQQAEEGGPAMKEQLLALPQDEDVWIAGAQLLRIPAKPGKGEQAVWLLVIQSRTQHLVLGTHTGGDPPDAQALLSALVEAMLEPKEGSARRPAAVEKGPNLSWGPVAPMLEQIGIAVHPAGPLHDLNTVFQYLSIQMTGRKLPDLPLEPD
jgi:hypothetical protein